MCVASVEQFLGTNKFDRLRVGIGQPAHLSTPQLNHAAFVLQRFTPDENIVVEKSLDMARDAVLCWLRDGAEIAMRDFNGSRVEFDEE
jgi:PTH1 family peptidyl-tRNA hydrolase